MVEVLMYNISDRGFVDAIISWLSEIWVDSRAYPEYPFTNRKKFFNVLTITVKVN